MKVFKSKNGGTLLYKKSKINKAISFNILFAAGSSSDEIPGTAHFLEHMLLSGTSNMDRTQIINFATTKNTSLNALTSMNWIKLVGECSTKVINEVFPLYFDLAFNSSFNKDILDLERKSIIEEVILYDNQLDSVMRRNMINSMYTSTEYKNDIAILGDKNSLEKIDLETLTAFKNKYFTKDNLYICICGNISYRKIKKLANDHFFSKPIPKGSMAVHKYDSIMVDKKPTLSVYNFNQTQSLIYVAFNIPFNRKDKYLCEVGNCLHYLVYYKLFDRLRFENGLCYNCGTTGDGSDTESIFIFFALTSKDKINKTIEEICKLAKELKKQKFSEKDIQDYIDAKVLQADKTIPSNNSLVASQYFTYTHYGKTYNKLKTIKKIKLEDVNQLLMDFLAKEPFIIVTTDADKKDIISYKKALSFFK